MLAIKDDISKVEMLSKLKKARFEIKNHTSFVFSLFPLMMVSRFTFELILGIDELLIRIGVRLPFGGSLIVVAVKK